MDDLHAVLDVDRHATPAEVRTAFRRWAATNHPDRGGDGRRFAVVAAAVDRRANPVSQPDIDAYRSTTTATLRRWAHRRWQRRRHPRVR